MKTIFKLGGLILIMLNQCACHTTKLSNRQQDRIAVLEQTDTRSREQENIQYSRSHSITDSSGQFYQVTIFPADSFQFSVQEGFQGKASKVEFRGSIRQLMRMNDSSALIVSADRVANMKVNRKVRAQQLSHFKSVEKTGFS